MILRSPVCFTQGFFFFACVTVWEERCQCRAALCHWGKKTFSLG